MDSTARWQKLGIALAFAGCGFDSTGDGVASSGSSSSTGSASTDASGDPSTDPVTTMETTDPATTDPATTDPATTDPSETDPATTDPATTDPATTDPTLDDSSGDPSLGTTGDVPEAYTPCPDFQCPMGQLCAEHPRMPGLTTCREPCLVDEDCTVPATGNAEVRCFAPNYPWCVLDCDPGSCPDGQTCHALEFGDSCYWEP